MASLLCIPNSCWQQRQSTFSHQIAQRCALCCWLLICCQGRTARLSVDFKHPYTAYCCILYAAHCFHRPTLSIFPGYDTALRFLSPPSPQETNELPFKVCWASPHFIPTVLQYGWVSTTPLMLPPVLRARRCPSSHLPWFSLTTNTGAFSFCLLMIHTIPNFSSVVNSGILLHSVFCSVHSNSLDGTTEHISYSAGTFY